VGDPCHLNDDGEAYPSITTLTKETDQHRRTVLSGVKELRRLDLIYVDRSGISGNGGPTNRYRIPPRFNVTGGGIATTSADKLVAPPPPPTSKVVAQPSPPTSKVVANKSAGGGETVPKVVAASPPKLLSELHKKITPEERARAPARDGAAAPRQDQDPEPQLAAVIAQEAERERTERRFLPPDELVAAVVERVSRRTGRRVTDDQVRSALPAKEQ